MAAIWHPTATNTARMFPACSVAEWLKRADEPDKALVLWALQIGATATAEETRISGMLPTELPSFLADGSLEESEFKAYHDVHFDRFFRPTK